MENTYLGEIPEELFIIILSYLPHDDIYKLNKIRYIQTEIIFASKYNELYILIKTIYKKTFMTTYWVLWDLIFDDMRHIQYDKLIESLNNDNIEFDVEDNLGVLNSSTVNIIYTCLLKTVGFNMELIDEVNKKIFESNFHPMYIYLFNSRKDPDVIKLSEKIENIIIKSFLVYYCILIVCPLSLDKAYLLSMFEKYSSACSTLRIKGELYRVLEDPTNGNYFYNLHNYFKQSSQSSPLIRDIIYN